MYCVVVLLFVFRPQGLVAILLDNVDGPPSSDLLPALANPPLKIASFNIQVFGHTKFEHKDVLDVLVKVSGTFKRLAVKVNEMCLLQCFKR